jgi:hypothetical protein
MYCCKGSVKIPSVDKNVKRDVCMIHANGEMHCHSSGGCGCTAGKVCKCGPGCICKQQEEDAKQIKKQNAQAHH